MLRTVAEIELLKRVLYVQCTRKLCKYNILYIYIYIYIYGIASLVQSLVKRNIYLATSYLPIL
jgi:hypothetical protein